MAQVGDTITYTFSDGSSVAEDVSNVDEVVVDYLYAPGGEININSPDQPATSGGAVENVVVDVSNLSTIYIWVGGGQSQNEGRYEGSDSTSYGGGSTEISDKNTNSQTSGTEPFIVAAGGGAGAFKSADTIFGVPDESGGGARGGVGSIVLAQGSPPPAGGDGGTSSSAATPGDGAVSGHGSTVPIVETGSTTAGGGSAPENNGEVKLSFQSSLSPPDPPSNLSATQQ